MTLRFKFKYYSDVDEWLDVSVSRDGEISFNDRDIEYDMAFQAMGGDPSMATMFLQAWNCNLWEAVFIMVRRDNAMYGRFLVDCADHAFGVYKNSVFDNSIISESLLAARNYYASPENREFSRVLEMKTALFGLVREASFAGDHMLVEAAEAAYKIINTIYSHHNAYSDFYVEGLMVGSIKYCANMVGSIRAVSSGVSIGMAVKKESNWQWHRFYDIMTELQAGRDWPPMEATP